MSDDIEEIKRKLKILVNELIIGISSLKILESSKDYPKVFDNTKTAHVINTITWSLYQSAILNIRKAFDPKQGNPDACNIQNIIKGINDNKEILKSFYKSEEQFYNKLGTLNSKWDLFWNDHLVKEIKDGRDLVAHIRIEETVVLPSTDKQMKVASELINLLENYIHPLVEGFYVDYYLEIDEITSLSKTFWNNIYNDNILRKIP